MADASAATGILDRAATAHSNANKTVNLLEVTVLKNEHGLLDAKMGDKVASTAKGAEKWGTLLARLGRLNNAVQGLVAARNIGKSLDAIDAAKSPEQRALAERKLRRDILDATLFALSLFPPTAATARLVAVALTVADFVLKPAIEEFHKKVEEERKQTEALVEMAEQLFSPLAKTLTLYMQGMKQVTAQLEEAMPEVMSRVGDAMARLPDAKRQLARNIEQGVAGLTSTMATITKRLEQRRNGGARTSGAGAAAPAYSAAELSGAGGGSELDTADLVSSLQGAIEEHLKHVNWEAVACDPALGLAVEAIARDTREALLPVIAALLANQQMRVWKMRATPIEVWRLYKSTVHQLPLIGNRMSWVGRAAFALQRIRLPDEPLRIGHEVPSKMNPEEPDLPMWFHMVLMALTVASAVVLGRRPCSVAAIDEHVRQLQHAYTDLQGLIGTLRSMHRHVVGLVGGGFLDMRDQGAQARVMLLSVYIRHDIAFVRGVCHYLADRAAVKAFMLLPMGRVALTSGWTQKKVNDVMREFDKEREHALDKINGKGSERAQLVTRLNMIDTELIAHERSMDAALAAAADRFGAPPLAWKAAMERLNTWFMSEFTDSSGFKLATYKDPRAAPRAATAVGASGGRVGPVDFSGAQGFVASLARRVAEAGSGTAGAGAGAATATATTTVDAAGVPDILVREVQALPPQRRDQLIAAARALTASESAAVTATLPSPRIGGGASGPGGATGGAAPAVGATSPVAAASARPPRGPRIDKKHVATVLAGFQSLTPEAQSALINVAPPDMHVALGRCRLMSADEACTLAQDTSKVGSTQRAAELAYADTAATESLGLWREVAPTDCEDWLVLPAERGGCEVDDLLQGADDGMAVLGDGPGAGDSAARLAEAARAKVGAVLSSAMNRFVDGSDADAAIFAIRRSSLLQEMRWTRDHLWEKSTGTSVRSVNAVMALVLMTSGLIAFIDHASEGFLLHFMILDAMIGGFAWVLYMGMMDDNSYWRRSAARVRTHFRVMSHSFGRAACSLLASLLVLHAWNCATGTNASEGVYGGGLGLLIAMNAGYAWILSRRFRAFAASVDSPDDLIDMFASVAGGSAAADGKITLAQLGSLLNSSSADVEFNDTEVVEAACSMTWPRTGSSRVALVDLLRWWRAWAPTSGSASSGDAPPAGATATGPTPERLGPATAAAGAGAYGPAAPAAAAPAGASPLSPSASSSGPGSAVAGASGAASVRAGGAAASSAPRAPRLRSQSGDAAATPADGPVSLGRRWKAGFVQDTVALVLCVLSVLASLTAIIVEASRSCECPLDGCQADCPPCNDVTIRMFMSLALMVLAFIVALPSRAVRSRLPPGPRRLARLLLLRQVPLLGTVRGRGVIMMLHGFVCLSFWAAAQGFLVAVGFLFLLAGAAGIATAALGASAVAKVHGRLSQAEVRKAFRAAVERGVAGPSTQADAAVVTVNPLPGSPSDGPKGAGDAAATTAGPGAGATGSAGFAGQGAPAPRSAQPLQCTSAKTFAAALQELQVVLKSPSAEALFSEADINCEDCVSEDNFVAWMRPRGKAQ